MSPRTAYIKPQRDRNSPFGATRLVMRLMLQLLRLQRLARPFASALTRNRTYNLQNQCSVDDGRTLRFQGASAVAPHATLQAFTIKGRTSDRNGTAIRSPCGQNAVGRPFSDETRRWLDSARWSGL